MTTFILVRPVLPTERDAFIAMALASWHDAYVGHLPQAEIDEAPAMLARAWEKRQGAFRVAILDGAVAGFYSLGDGTDSGGEINYLWHLYVDPALQRRGVGRALNEAALAELAGRGATLVWLDVHEANAKAIAFYRALGWQDAGPIADEPGYLRMETMAGR